MFLNKIKQHFRKTALIWRHEILYEHFIGNKNYNRTASDFGMTRYQLDDMQFLGRLQKPYTSVEIFLIHTVTTLMSM